MKRKLSEKRFLLSILLLIGATVLLLKAGIFNAPVQVSEKGILLMLLGMSFFVTSVKLLKQSLIKY
jgi:uncharacterized membrane protein YiaA